jgi:hypothetical protein
MNTKLKVFIECKEFDLNYLKKELANYRLAFPDNSEKIQENYKNFIAGRICELEMTLQTLNKLYNGK